MSSFDARHFMKTFNSSPYYDGNINGFDIMIMENSEKADKIIEEAKEQIDYLINNNLLTNNFSFSYNPQNVLELDQMRIDKEIKQYCSSRGIYLN